MEAGEQVRYVAPGRLHDWKTPLRRALVWSPPAYARSFALVVAVMAALGSALMLRYAWLFPGIWFYAYLAVDAFLLLYFMGNARRMLRLMSRKTLLETHLQREEEPKPKRPRVVKVPLPPRPKTPKMPPRVKVR